MDVDGELIKDHEIMFQAEQAGKLSRSITRNPQAKNCFIQAYRDMAKHAQGKERLTVELLGQYSLEAMRYTNMDQTWETRFMDPRAQVRTSDIIERFYVSLEQHGKLTLDNLTQLYDELNVHEPFLDGNKRSSILAISHLLIANGYNPPDFSQTSHDRLGQLKEQYPSDKRRATREFLKECVTEDLPDQ